MTTPFKLRSSGPFKMMGSSPTKEVIPTSSSEGDAPENYEARIDAMLKTEGWNEGTKYSDLSDEDKKRISSTEYQKLLSQKIEAKIKEEEKSLNE